MSSKNLVGQSLNLVRFSVTLFCLPSGLAAAPVVENAFFSDSGTIAIEGTGFGSGPNVAIHDDFSDAVFSGDTVSLAPQVGVWLRDESTSTAIEPYIDYKYGSTSLFARGNGESKLVFGIPDEAGPHGLKTFQEVYFAYTIRDLAEFPGPNGGMNEFSTQSSTKDAWMMLGARGDNTEYAVSQGQAAGHDLYVPAWTGDSFNIAGNNTYMSPSYWQHELTKNWVFGGWHTNMFHAKLNSSDPYGKAEGFFSFLNDKIYHVNNRAGNFMEDQRSEGVPYAAWDRIKFFAWMRTGDADVKRVVDEVYVAIGENANARVVLTDSKSIENSTRIFHLSPDRWNDSEIVVRFPDYLSDNNPYYLHVFNTNNAVSAGYNLCRSCPAPPKILPVK